MIKVLRSLGAALLLVCGAVFFYSQEASVSKTVQSSRLEHSF